MASCDNCNQIIDTVYLEFSAPTVFDEIFFDGNLCSGCHVIIQDCVDEYTEFYNRLTKKVLVKMAKLDINTKRKMR
jgi:hypothetical protein